MPILYSFSGWTTEQMELELAAVQVEIRRRRTARITQGSSSGQSWSVGDQISWEALWEYHNALAAALGHFIESDPGMSVARPDFSGRGGWRY